MQSFQLDLYEPNINLWVGNLQMMVTNQGKRVDLEDMVKSPKGGNTKMSIDSPLKNKKPHEAGKTG